MKQFGKIVNRELQKPSYPIKHNDRDYFTTDPQLMLELGWKELVYTQRPISTEGQYIFHWEETDTQLIQTWELIQYSEEEQKKLYEIEVSKNIKEKYSLNDEIAILRKYIIDKETYQNEFNEYNSYVEQSKQKARKKIYKK